jgi:hypothetical protein
MKTAIRTVDRIERDVRRLGARLPADDRLVVGVMRLVKADRAARMADAAAAPDAAAAADVRARARRRMILRGSMAVAACVLLGLGLWIVLASTAEGSLYAQIAAAMIEAKSLHAVGSRWQDGRWEKELEVMYERDKGSYEWSRRRAGAAQVRVDDGGHTWRFSPDDAGAAIVRRSPSRDRQFAVHELLARNRLVEAAHRDPLGDETIDGVTCCAYTILRESGKLKHLVLVDGRHRIRRLEESTRRDDGTWQPRAFSTIAYDVAIDPNAFVPQIPAGATIIDADGSEAAGNRSNGR